MKSANDLHEAILPDERHPSITLGDYLCVRREQKHASIDEMARELKIAPRYVAALEEGAYGLFSAKIYAHGFLKRSLVFLGVPDGDEQYACLNLFQEEWAAYFLTKAEGPVALPKPKKYVWLLTPGRLMHVIGGIILIAFSIFLGIQLMHFTGTPRLVFVEPSDGFVINHPFVRVIGTTEKESQLTVNGREITIDTGGGFDTHIDLQPGVNMLEFLVRNRFGKEKRVIRAGVVR